MNDEAGFYELRPLCRTGNEALFRAQRQVRGKTESAILRVYDDAELASKELELIGSFTPVGVLGPPERPAKAQSGHLLLPDIIGIPLSSELNRDPIGESEARRFLRSMAIILGNLHNAGLLHLAIVPSNILCTDSGYVLTGLGHGRRLGESDPDFLPRAYPQEYFAYLPPELRGGATGKIGPWSDYFSLGAVAYRLLCGLPAISGQHGGSASPVIAYDPPPPLHLIRSGISRNLSDLVLRLLACAPGDRPAVAGAILRYLDTKPRQWLSQEGRRIIQEARSAVGRRKEQELIHGGFDRAREGNSELFIITGPSGMGKTSLVKDTIGEIGSACAAIMLYGKFEMDSTVPYLPYAQAVSSLAGITLGLSEEAATELRTAAREAFSGLQDKVLEIFPELSALLSDSVDLTYSIAGGNDRVHGESLAGPKERKNLMQGLMVILMEVSARIRRPTTLFIDDLQWADMPSLELLLMIARARIPGLMLLCAYRNDEVSDGHPGERSIQQLREMAGSASCLDLRPLTARNLCSLAEYRYPGLSRTEAAELGRRLYGRTGGNPYFSLQVLGAMEHLRQLHFDFLAEHWRFDIPSEPDHTPESENVIQFLAARMSTLPSRQRDILVASACLGRNIDPVLLSDALEIPVEIVRSDLERLANLGMFAVSTSPAYRCFSHDNVRHAAHLLLCSSKQAALHLRFGRLLRRRATIRLTEELYEAAEQGNAGLPAVTDADEAFEIAQTDLAAGKKAKAAGSFSTAYGYLRAGLEALPPSSWKERFDLTLAMHHETAELACLEGDCVTMDAIIAAAVVHCRGIEDELPFLETRINSLMASFRMPEIVELYVSTLERLGLRLRGRWGRWGVLLKSLWLRVLLRFSPLGNISRQPMKDRRMLDILSFMSTGFSAVYLVNRRVYELVCAIMLRLSLRYGESPYSPFALVGYASTITKQPGRIAEALRLTDYALERLEQRNLASLNAIITFTAYLFVKPWAAGFLEALEPLLSSYIEGKRHGDFDNSSLCITIYCSYKVMYGKDLGEAEREAAEFEAQLIELKQNRAIAAIRRHRQLALNLLGRGSSSCPVDFSGPSFDERVMEPVLIAANDTSGLVTYRCYMLFLAYLFGDYDRAQELARAIELRIGAIDNQAAIVGIYLLFLPLTVAAVLPGIPIGERSQLLREARPSRKRLSRLALISPRVYGPWRDLTEAEFSRVAGKPEKAERLFFRAISGADELGYLRDRALGRELLAAFYRRSERNVLSRLHQRDAYELYRDWGAIAKTRAMEEQDPWLLEKAPSPKNDPEASPPPTFSIVEGYAQFSQAIMQMRKEGSPFGIARLAIETVLHITGSDSGAIAFLKGQGEAIVFRAQKADSGIETFPAELEEIPERFAAYVTHTGKIIVLDNYAINGVGTKSAVLCAPIMHGNSCIGIIYATRGAVSGSFSIEHTQFVEMLSLQAAASYMNMLQRSIQEAQHELQKQVQEAERLAALGRRTAMVAHELNNPNHLIGLGTARIAAVLDTLLAEQEDAGLTPDSRKRVAIEAALRDIKEASVRVDLLIRDIQGSATGSENFIPIDLNTIILNCLQVLSDSPKRGDAELRTALMPSPPPILGDHRKLQQVLINLVENSFQSIIAPNKIVLISTREEKDHLILEVSDNGEGIAAELLPKVSEPFFTTRKERGGSGLGLAIVREIIGQLGGTLCIESELGKGTRVTIRFPVFHPG